MHSALFFSFARAFVLYDVRFILVDMTSNKDCINSIYDQSYPHLILFNNTAVSHEMGFVFVFVFVFVYTCIYEFESVIV